jgi:hypothetical protein
LPGAVYRVGRDLQEGDLLVPLVGTGPCVLITRAHVGLVFSRNFAALRPTNSTYSMLLWAVLSSTSGLEARHQSESGSAVQRIPAAALTDLLVPERGTLSTSVAALLPEPVIDAAATAPLMSRWKAIRLQNQSSWASARLLDLREETEGVLVAELGSVWAGRIDVRTYKEAPFPGGVPALRPEEVGRLSTPRWWTSAEKRDIAKPESILIGALSFRIATLPTPVAIPKNILVLEVHASRSLSAMEVRDRLASYFASSVGHHRLLSRAKGTTMSRLSKKDLLELTVPPPEELPTVKPAATELLATRLEKALWS